MGRSEVFLKDRLSPVGFRINQYSGLQALKAGTSKACRAQGFRLAFLLRIRHRSRRVNPVFNLEIWSGSRESGVENKIFSSSKNFKLQVHLTFNVIVV